MRSQGAIAAALLLALAPAVGGCSGSKHAAPTHPATTPPSAPASVGVTTSAPGSTTTVTDVLPTLPLPCTPLPIPSTPVTSPAPAHSVLLASVQELGDKCVDHVAFGFTSKAADPPGYMLTYGAPPFAQDGSGAPVAVKGESFVVVKVKPAYTYDFENSEPSYTGSKRITPAHANHVTEIVETGDYEGVLTWVIGLDAKRPFSVQATGRPQTQLVVTIS